MEPVEKWNKDLLVLKLLNNKLNSKGNGTKGMIAKNLLQILKIRDCLPLSTPHSDCGAGSCPDLGMSRSERPGYKHITMTSTPKLPVRSHRPLCLSVSSDGNGRYAALESQDFKSSLKSQMDKATGASSSTGSLERASLFCASGSTSTTSNLTGSNEALAKTKSSSRFSRFSAPWNSSSESDSNPPSRTGSKRLKNHSRKTANKTDSPKDSKRGIPEQLQYSEPVIAKVTEYIYVGNVNAAYSGRVLCRNNIDSIIDMSNLPEESNMSLIPCTCTKNVKHSWSRLKVNIRDFSNDDVFPLKEHCFEDINGCISASAEKQKRVLVHCRDGYSLAPTCIIQFLMLKQNMHLLTAYEFVRSKYPLNIKEHHQNLLVTLEKSLRPGKTDPECFKQALSRKIAWT
ncbi:uncharacterized protein LOC129705747 isoform X1 [Leucoraja erinacea]|uniref:uncharacterized protein LOC129705747 isoform X1 n=2 Tax=Leucoraja erinaceus TaxID=7782 RepID=UPI002454D363|nr:uncharacterized protein LOC129705747 isoform X1 [Leucoraja erinacea]XP_055505497.1 uncharacterized protein LOC129705747 isoform X1 [Leucoraja erinacea]